MADKLREPNGFFQETVRRLAEAAMQATHHDIDHSKPEAISEIQAMERKFSAILRGKLVAPRRAAIRQRAEGEGR